MSKVVVNISKIIGSGYKKLFTDTTHRFNVIKGGRGSGKSKTTAIYIIYTMLKYPKMNCLCCRQNYNTLYDSVFSDLVWACERLHVTHLFTFQKSPLRIIRKETNQQIIFRGFSDAISLTSISVPQGYLNLVWLEEAWQIKNYDDFEKLNYSIRGELEEGYFFKFIITFNPYNVHHWLFSEFFQKDNPNALCWTTTYKQNPFVGEEFNKLMEQMKIDNPRKYRVLGEGHFGVMEGIIFDNWRVEDLDLTKVPNKENLVISTGMDFGYQHLTTVEQIAVDFENKKIYVFKELARRFMTADDMADMLISEGLDKTLIWGDSSRPEVIEHLNRKKCNVKPIKKGADSVLTSIQELQDFEIILDSSCKQLEEELSLYAWDTDKQGNTLEKPVKELDDAVDGLRYAWMGIRKPKKKSRIRSW